MDPQKPGWTPDPYDRLGVEDVDEPRIEEDTLKPLTPVRHSRSKLPAAVSFALMGILAIGGIAFGANVVLPLVGAPQGTPVIEPDDTEPPDIAITTEEPTAEPTDVAVVEPTDEVTDPTEEPTATPTEEPTAQPTEKPANNPAPTQKATTKPPATGPVNLGNISVTDKGNNCYRFSWQGYTGKSFNYWKLVYGDWGTSPYYPAFPYWAVLDPGTTSWEGCIDAGDYAVRVQAIYYPNGSAVAAAQTNILHLTVTGTKATPAPTVNLGNLSVTKGTDGCYTFSWQAFSGVDFNYWKLVYGDWGTSPYYPDFPYWAALDPSTTSFKKCDIPTGDYAVRVQAIYYPTGSAYAAAQTNIYHLTVAAPTPTKTPTPVALTLSKSVQADGVHLSWTAYSGAGFQYYKVVRSETNTNPMYPENTGTTLVAAISNASETTFLDAICTAGTGLGSGIACGGSVQSGHTYYYRVIAYTFDGGGVVLGKSNVVTVTIP